MVMAIADSNRDEWNNFVKKHTIFKPFATQGWEFFFDDIQEILPATATARGKYIYNASGHSQASQSTDSQQSQFIGTPDDSQDTGSDAGQFDKDPFVLPGDSPTPAPHSDSSTPTPASHSVPLLLISLP
ncbi:hypothetical protein BT96DRAFT_1000920 [Gymnopus androsaceus JB14]|uniref:Uncharacterized protein n=1 Tax=Gymnopus androsaceus JB14 TaxID=1447944 RepID=A0A6A4H2F1_9AGAR|nr:hypothetical protein BT96DRAFT_1000920 [Gymnopus androsaceus JB14]